MTGDGWAELLSREQNSAGLAGPNLAMSDLLHDTNSFWGEHVSRPERLFLERVAEFAQRHVAPHADAWERAEELPREIFSRAGRIGLMGVVAPRRLGGQGFGYV